MHTHIAESQGIAVTDKHFKVIVLQWQVGVTARCNSSDKL